MIGRARLQQTAAGLRIMIPAPLRYRFFLRVVLRPVLAIFILWMIEQRFPDSPVFVAIVIAYAVTMLLAQLSWRFFGQEILTVNRNALTLRREIAGIGWTRDYPLDRLSRLRVGTFRAGGQNIPDAGFLVFDNDSPIPWTETAISLVAAFHMRSYEPKRPHFGRGLSQAECQELIRVMESYAGISLIDPQLSANNLPQWTAQNSAGIKP
jgi:hypothetical protein